MRRRALRSAGWLAAGLALGAGAAAAAAPPGPPPAEISVQGLGLLSDRALRGSLILLLGNQRGPVLRAGAIEDAALILFSHLADTGYLQPELTVEAVLADGARRRFTLDPSLEPPLPRELAATAVSFRVRRGRRFDLGEVRFRGLTVLREDQARPYFRVEGLLASLAAERAYSPGRLHRSAGNLLEELRRLGYADAAVTVADPPLDPHRSQVDVTIEVRAGPLWRVQSLQARVVGGGPLPPPMGPPHFGRPWSIWWRHDAEGELRRWYYDHGYPDAVFRLEPQAAPPVAGERAVVVLATIRPGPNARLTGVRFAGNTRTHTARLRPMVKARAGDLVNPTVLQEGQYRLARLGVFRAVDLSYEPPDGPERTAVYTVEEGKKHDVDLLLGYGSYEQLRGGVEWHDYDLFNLAHEGTLKFVQSFKATQAEYDYSIPELDGSSADLTGKLFGFRRQERAFVDEQYGVTVTVATPVPRLGSELLIGYTFDKLRAPNDTLATLPTDIRNANATSVQATLTRDRRDNPLVPRKGYKLSLQAVEASRYLGGQVDFQQFELSGSYHTPWGHSRWIHLGLTHDVITTYLHGPNETLPPNIFFYPGGQDSIRGYSQGEAAPRDATGRFLPAQTATLLNLELEQALTSKLSVVLFNDDLGAASRLGRYPWDYRLYTVGLGLRYQTIVGPIRLEYGRNLNPRPHDPQGALQFSVGFPF